jgi:polyribonucleotide nucleotidyltransferase
METFGEPRRDGGGPRLLAVALAVALAVIGLAIVFVARRPEKEPGPRSASAGPSPSPRPAPSTSTAPAEAPSTRRRPEAEALGAATTSLRVDSDVPGASVFVDRRFLGTTPLASSDGVAMQKALDRIRGLTAEAEVGRIYRGTVRRVVDFGAFVEIMPGTDGLLHVSEIANHRVKDVRDELKEGEQLLVKVINIDPTGKIRLSRKALLQEEAAAKPN